MTGAFLFGILVGAFLGAAWASTYWAGKFARTWRTYEPNKQRWFWSKR